VECRHHRHGTTVAAAAAATENFLISGHRQKISPILFMP